MTPGLGLLRRAGRRAAELCAWSADSSTSYDPYSGPDEWRRVVSAKLGELSAVRAGWSGAGSMPLDPRAASGFRLLLVRAGGLANGDFEPALTRGGGLEICWKRGGEDYSAEASADGGMRLSRVSADGECGTRHEFERFYPDLLLEFYRRRELVSWCPPGADTRRASARCSFGFHDYRRERVLYDPSLDEFRVLSRHSLSSAQLARAAAEAGWNPLVHAGVARKWRDLPTGHDQCVRCPSRRMRRRAGRGRAAE